MADQLADILKTLTLTQLKYVECRLGVSSEAEAARLAGITRQAYYAWDNRAEVDEAVRLLRMDGITLAAEYLRREATKAARTLTNNLDNKNPQIRHNAAVEVLNRTVGKPTDKREVSGPGGGPQEVKVIIEYVEAPPT